MKYDFQFRPVKVKAFRYYPGMKIPKWLKSEDWDDNRENELSVGYCGVAQKGDWIIKEKADEPYVLSHKKFKKTFEIIFP